MALSAPDVGTLRLCSAQWLAPRASRPVAPVWTGIPAAQRASRHACLAPSRPFNNAAGADTKADFLPSAATAEAPTSSAGPSPPASGEALIPQLQSLVRRLERAASYTEKVRSGVSYATTPSVDQLTAAIFVAVSSLLSDTSTLHLRLQLDIVLQEPEVRRFLNGTREGATVGRQLGLLPRKQAFVLACLPAIGQAHVLSVVPTSEHHACDAALTFCTLCPLLRVVAACCVLCAGRRALKLTCCNSAVRSPPLLQAWC